MPSQQHHLNEENPPIAEINIIPFVDIILVLLIIFMVTTPLLIKAGFSIQLPTASHAQNITASKVNIIVEASGKILLEGKVVSLKQLTQVLKKRKLSANSYAIISADKNILHGRVIAIINATQAGGLQKIAIATTATKKSLPVNKSK